MSNSNNRAVYMGTLTMVAITMFLLNWTHAQANSNRGAFTSISLEQVGHDNADDIEIIYAPDAKYGLAIYRSDKYIIPIELQNALLKALDTWPNTPPENNIFYLISLRWESSWGLATVTSANLGVEQSLESTKETPIALDNTTALVFVKESDDWKAAIESAEEFSGLVNSISDTLLSPEAKRAFALLSDSTTSENFPSRTDLASYKLPWPSGIAFRTTKGWHDDGYLSGLNALDFAPLSSPGTYILAAASGTIVKVCGLGNETQYYVQIQTENTSEQVGYLHIDGASFRSLGLQQGDYVAQGDKLGKMVQGWLKGRCGYSQGTHIHFHFPSKPFTIDNTTFSNSDVHENEKLYSTQGISPIGYIDSPINGNFLTGNSTISGWAKVDGSAISSVEIYIDGQKSGDAVYGDARPDVGGNYGYHWDWNTTQVRDGSHTIEVKATAASGASSWLLSSGAGNPSLVSVIVDNSPPTFPDTVTNSGCGALTNRPQNFCNDPHFTWPAANDAGGSGVKDYLVYWGTDNQGTPTESTNGQTAYHPDQPIAATGSYYLRVAPIDNLDQQGLATQLFTFRYDITPPAASFTIQNGAQSSSQVNVLLDIAASDVSAAGSENPANLTLQLSNNTVAWQEKPYQTPLPWSIPALDHHDITVYLQVRDLAGNLSPVVTDSIYLDLYASAPNSASYRLCHSVWDAAGSANLTSTSYVLASAVGQAWSGGEAPISSTTYSNTSGFLANTTGCLPIDNNAPPAGYTVKPSVMASGGSLRGSVHYRVGDTIGQPAASETTPMTSASFQLSSGFWSGITDTIPTRPVNMPAMRGLAALPTPPPAPLPPAQPNYFGVEINANAQYASQTNASLNIAAPNVSEMRISLNPEYADDQWLAYSTTASIVLSDTAPEPQPQFVYIWFRDLRGEVYGPFADSIWYDRSSPQGEVMILGSDEITTTIGLWLEAYDNLSGVSLMRISTTPAFTDTTWVEYREIVEWSLADPTSIPVFYAQFQDQAGNLSPVYDTDDEIYQPDIFYVYLPSITR